MENTQNTQSTINAAAESTAVAQSPVIEAKATSKPKRAYHRLTDEEKAQRAKDFEAYKAGVAERKAKRAEKKAAAEAALKNATSVIEGACSKGVYHKNNAARKVSRLAKLVNGVA